MSEPSFDSPPDSSPLAVPPPLPESVPLAPVQSALSRRVAAIRAEVGKAFIGQMEVLEQILVALLAGGHVLIEGVPGLGKTLLVRALSAVLVGV